MTLSGATTTLGYWKAQSPEGLIHLQEAAWRTTSIAISEIRLGVEYDTKGNLYLASFRQSPWSVAAAMVLECQLY